MTSRKQATSCTNSSNNSSTSSDNSSYENLHEKMFHLALKNKQHPPQFNNNIYDSPTNNNNHQKTNTNFSLRRSTSLYARRPSSTNKSYNSDKNGSSSNWQTHLDNALKYSKPPVVNSKPRLNSHKNSISSNLQEFKTTPKTYGSLSRSKSLKIPRNIERGNTVSTPTFSSHNSKSFMAEFRENIRNSDEKMVSDTFLETEDNDNKFSNPVKAYRSQRNCLNLLQTPTPTILRTRSLGYRKGTRRAKFNKIDMI